MSYRKLPNIEEELLELKERLRQERDSALRPRLHLLVLIKSQEISSQTQAAEHLAVHRNTISDWLGRYRQGGLDRLLEHGQRGKPAGQKTVPEPVFESLKQRLNEPEGFAGYTDVQQWLLEEFGLKVPYPSVYGLVRYHLGAKLKVPRPEHPKKA